MKRLANRLRPPLALRSWRVALILLGVAVCGLIVGWIVYAQWLYRPITPVKPPPYTAQVTSHRVDSVGNDVFRPGTGYHYEIVQVSITNASSADLALAPVIQTHLRASNGDRFEMAPAPLDAPFEAGVVAPGETRSGDLSYLVPDTAAGLLWVFQPDEGFSETVVSLGRN